jgi:hypothetical protein
MNMSTDNKVNLQGQDINDFYLPDESQIKKLRKIINSESGFKYTYSQTEEISYQLLMLYEELARGQHILAGEPGHESRE